MKTAPAIILFAVALVFGGSVKADIIDGSYTVNSSDSSVNSAKGFPNTNTFNAGTTESFIGTPVDLSFLFSGSTLTLTETVYAGASPLNASFNWIFSALNLGGVDTVTGVTLASSTDAGAVITTGFGNDINITTPTGMLVGVHQWVFNIQNSGTVAAVPEPSSFAFLALGGVGIWLKRRRQVA